MFTFAEKGASFSQSSSEKKDTLFGITLLLAYLFCDSFTSQWQSRVYKRFGIDQYQMMLGINVWSCGLTALSLLQSGEGLTCIALLIQDPEALLDNVILSIASAIGQLFIFLTIREHGPVIFTIMMTTRQIFSLILSCFLFAHNMSLFASIGAALVFVIVFNRIRRKGSD